MVFEKRRLILGDRGQAIATKLHDEERIPKIFGICLRWLPSVIQEHFMLTQSQIFVITHPINSLG